MIKLVLGKEHSNITSTCKVGLNYATNIDGLINIVQVGKRYLSEEF